MCRWQRPCMQRLYGIGGRGGGALKPRQRNPVRDHVHPGSMLCQVRAVAHRRTAGDDRIDQAEDPRHDRAVDLEDARLAHHVAVIRHHRRAAAAQQPLGGLAHGIGEMQVDHIRSLAQQPPGERKAQRRRCHRGDPSRAHHEHAVLPAHGRTQTARVRHQRGDFMAPGCLPFSQQPDVVFDAAQDGPVVFVDVEDLHVFPSSSCVATRR